MRPFQIFKLSGKFIHYKKISKSITNYAMLKILRHNSICVYEIPVDNAGFELMTFRFVVNALTNCATLFSNNFGEEKLHKFVLDFIANFNRKSVTIWRCHKPHYFYIFLSFS